MESRPGRTALEDPIAARRRHLGYAAALTIGTGVPILLFAVPWLVRAAGVVETGASLGILAFVLAFPRISRALGAPATVGFVRLLTVFGFALAIVSIVTGFQNGLTDEPYTTPRYAGLLLGGHNPYATPLVFDYTQYGQNYHSTSFYVYLPLLQFAVLPGVDYRWISLASWVGIALAVRKDPYAGVLLAQPYVVLIAASGYNDLLVLLLLTLAFVGVNGRRQRWAEYLALGMKQFANVIVLVYYLVKRDFGRAALTAVITVAFLVPFLLWNPLPTLCNSLAYGVPAACAPYSNHDEPGWNWNYSIYAVWLLAAFHRPLGAWLARVNASTIRPLRASRAGRLGEGFLRYGLVGASGVVVNLVLFTLAGSAFGTAGARVLVASALAFAGAMLWNFAWNYTWTFAGRTGRSLPIHLSFYAIIQLAALAVNLGVLDGLVAVGVAPVLAQFVGIAVASGGGFLANLRWNFIGTPARGPGGPPPSTTGRELGGPPASTAEEESVAP